MVMQDKKQNSMCISLILTSIKTVNRNCYLYTKQFVNPSTYGKLQDSYEMENILYIKYIKIVNIKNIKVTDRTVSRVDTISNHHWSGKHHHRHLRWHYRCWCWLLLWIPHSDQVCCQTSSNNSNVSECRFKHLVLEEEMTRATLLLGPHKVN